jgi:hypothetical protein
MRRQSKILPHTPLGAQIHAQKICPSRPRPIIDIGLEVHVHELGVKFTHVAANRHPLCPDVAGKLQVTFGIVSVNFNLSMRVAIATRH